MNQTNNVSRTDLISAIFLVAGTCIGGGMLALPVATGVGGFLPSIAVMTVCWIFMTLSALLLLEASLWMEEGVHVSTMSSRLLGKPGQWVSWILYLFISYASIIGYTASGGHQMAGIVNYYFGLSIHKNWGCVVFIFLFGAVLDLGSRVVGRINTICFVAMIAAYFALIGTGISEVKAGHLIHREWFFSFMAVPIILTTFSFQTLVPSLTPYLKRNASYLRWAIIGGTSVTFLVYGLWQGLFLGIVPLEGPHGLRATFELGELPSGFFSQHVAGWWVSVFAEFFAFFAIITSFFGMGLGLFDFLSDGLKIPERGWGKLILAALIAIPTLFFATQFERVFIIAMEVTGGIGDSILNGIIPVMMVWIGRYVIGYKGPKQVPGGKLMLAVIFCFFFATFMIQLLSYIS